MADPSTPPTLDNDRGQPIEAAIRDLVRLCARQAAREWLAEACPADPTKEGDNGQ